MGCRMQSKCANNLDYLWRLLLQIWNDISYDFRDLIDGVVCRIEAVIATKRGQNQLLTFDLQF